MPHGSSIVVQGLRKAFHCQEVLKGVALEIEPGSLTAIIGRSGCGKSTLLRCLNGLEVFDEGSVSFGELRLERKPGESLHHAHFEKAARALRGGFGMVFQSFNLFPHFTVLENLTIAPMTVKGLSRPAAEAIARPLLEKVGLSSHAKHYPSQMSGGQQQRAAIARALAMSPRVMLYDEPTSALDPWLVDEVFQVMRTLNAEGMTQVVVTHEMRFVREVAKRIAFMDAGEVVEAGPVEQMFNAPKDPRTRQYMSKVAA